MHEREISTRTIYDILFGDNDRYLAIVKHFSLMTPTPALTHLQRDKWRMSKQSKMFLINAMFCYHVPNPCKCEFRNESWRYLVYHALFLIMPTCLRDRLVEKFVQGPSWTKPKINDSSIVNKIHEAQGGTLELSDSGDQDEDLDCSANKMKITEEH